MDSKQIRQMMVHASVVGTITGLTCALAQRLVIGEVSPAITAGVTGAVTAALLSSLDSSNGRDADQVVETE